jgi:chromosomal replication initiator protein
MELTAGEVWTRILESAKSALPEQAFRTWLAPTQAVAISQDLLVVSTPNPFAVNWVEDKYADLLAGIGERLFGRRFTLSVQFQGNGKPAGDPIPPSFTQPPTVVSVASPGRAAPAPAAPAAPPAPARIFSPLNPRYTFERFVVGSNNQLASAAAHAVAQAPAKNYNPLFIYGGVGLGKTHLMHAIGHAMLERDPGKRVMYLSSERFTNELVSAIQEGSMAEFRRQYRQIDLLLVDDIQFLEGKERTQEEFFHTFNALHDAQRQIVLTSDRPPKEIPGLEARLVSRFEWGMVADIGQPDLEHRIAILQKKQEQDHLEQTIPDDVLRFIAEHVRSSVRELEGCIIKMLLYASLKHKEISIELAREALSDKIRAGEADGEPRPLPTINKVQEVVARRWGVTPEGLRSKARIKTLTVPRQIAMFLARDLLQMQLVEIGQAFGGRDHSTVIHSVDKVARLMTRDRGFREKVELARMELSPE